MTETNAPKPKLIWYKQNRLWKGLGFVKRFFFRSIFKVQEIMLILSIQSFPIYSYLFSPLKRLTLPHERLKKTDNFMDDFSVVNDPISGTVELEERINIVMRGVSFDSKKLNELKGKTYLINFTERVEKTDVVYATADKNVFSKFIQKGMTPILLLDLMDENGKAYTDRRGIEKYILNGTVKRLLFRYSSSSALMGMGSGLILILALTKYTKHMTLYGFDHYQTKDLGEMSHLEALFSLNNFFYNGILSDIHPGTAPDVIEKALHTYHFANRFNEVPWIVNHGFLKNINKHKALVNKLDKIIYKQKK
jgi:hypothetical protein